MTKYSAGLYLPPSVVEKQEVKGGIVVEVGPGIPLGSPMMGSANLGKKLKMR